jgi:Domain of unknown function (DUF5664)
MSLKTDEQSTNPKDKVGRSKPCLSLVPSVAVIRAAEVMKLGAVKYGPYNWRDEKVSQLCYIDAADRHMKAYLDGEDLDQESGQPHLAHALCCMAILLDAIECGMDVDDRPKKGSAAELIRKLTIKPEKKSESNDNLKSLPADVKEEFKRAMSGDVLKAAVDGAKLPALQKLALKEAVDSNQSRLPAMLEENKKDFDRLVAREIEAQVKVKRAPTSDAGALNSLRKPGWADEQNPVFRPPSS